MMTVRQTRYALIAAILATIPLTRTLAEGLCPSTTTCPNTTACGETSSKTSSVSDRSNWPKIVVEAETLKDKTQCPIRFVSNVPRRGDNLPNPNQPVNEQLKQALSGAKAENHSKANLTALFVQPGAFALDIALVPLKALRGVIQIAKKPSPATEPTSPCSTDQTSTCP